MFGKKLPLKQPPPQVYEEEYSEQQSEPLIQQVDSNYEPNQRQVKEYAIQTLGMKLPEDQNLLYLAREGLKAPLPPNWVPYQSRQGQIYYKHKITQEKIYDHPTDIEYRKKYQQQKQKAARKNLKSLSLKQNLGMQGLLPNNASLASGLRLINTNNSGLGAGLSNLSGISAGQEFTEPTIDPQLVAEYEKQLQEFEKKQQKQWRQAQAQLQQEHQKKMKKIRDQSQQQRTRLQGKSGASKKSEGKMLQQQQRKLQKLLQQTEENSLAQQLKMIEKQQQNKLSQYKAVYQQDNLIKLRKAQHQLEHNYQQKSKALEEKLRKLSQRRQQQRENRAKILRQTKQQLQKPDNPEIANLLRITLDDNLKGIKQEYSRKIKQKQEQMEHQMHEMRKILGIDKSQNLLLLASRKQKLLNLSNMKMASKRNKQTQIIQSQFLKDLENQTNRLKEKLNRQNQDKIEAKKKQILERIQRQKILIQNQYMQKVTKNIQQLYQNSVVDKNNYETMMNKRMSDLRMKYINKLSQGGKNKQGKEEMIVNRVLLQQKQSQVTNKEELVKNLERQLQLERKQWKVMQFEEQLNKMLIQSDESSMNMLLKSKIKGMNINYKSPQLNKFVQTHRSLQSKYKQDKKLLVKILKALQDTAAYNLYQMKRNPYANDDGQISSSGTGAMVRKYNEDVRKMRDNQQMLNKFQTLLKKSELGGNSYEQNIAKLRAFVNTSMQYKQIALKEQIQKNGYKSANYTNDDKQLNSYKNLNINEMQMPAPTNDNQKDNKIKSSTNYSWNNGSTYPSASNSMQQALRDHSRFLSNVKNQLNKKLYQVRYQSRY